MSIQSRLSVIRDRVNSNDPAVKAVFTQLFDHDDLKLVKEGPLSDLLVGIKDLFDVSGYVTRAGSAARCGFAPAAEDAMSVARLRSAGAVLVGHTNMTELAYSGVGLNPHFGTPHNVLDPNCIPGGSTSGGAVAVALGLCDVALGTDTGGSLRIPAAFNGLVGFKPTQASVPRDGTIPLSVTLDSIGPIGKTVADCHRVWSVLAEDNVGAQSATNPTCVVPQNFGLTQLDPAVEKAFKGACKLLSKNGIRIEYRNLPSLNQYANHPVWQYSAVEGQAAHNRLYRSYREQLDPRVIARLARADGLTAVEYRMTLNERAELIREFRADLGINYLLLPTVAICPPRFDEIESNEDFDRINLLTLRNTTVANVMDACAISLPLTNFAPGTGLMLVAVAGQDAELLGFSQVCERLLLADRQFVRFLRAQTRE